MPTATPAPTASVFTVVGPSVTVNQGGTGAATAACPANATMVGGGYTETLNLANPVIHWSFPLRSPHLDCGRPTAGPTGGWCHGVYRLRQGQFCCDSFHRAKSGHQQQLLGICRTVTCSANTTLTGGGFHVDILEGDEPMNNGWVVTDRLLLLGDSSTITAYALCASAGIHAGSIATAASGNLPSEGAAPNVRRSMPRWSMGTERRAFRQFFHFQRVEWWRPPTVPRRV